MGTRMRLKKFISCVNECMHTQALPKYFPRGSQAQSCCLDLGIACVWLGYFEGKVKQRYGNDKVHFTYCIQCVADRIEQDASFETL